MKCSNCGHEVQLGEAYCPFCGKEIRIVPDYNVLEDDLNVMVEESKKIKQNSVPEENLVSDNVMNKGDENNLDEEAEAGKRPEKNPKKLIIILCSIVAAIFLIVIIYAFISTSKKSNSFDFQYKKAVEYMDEGLYDKAKECLDKALEIETGSEKAQLKLAELFMLQKKEAQAINQYIDIIEQYPNEKKAYEKLLAIYEDQKNTKAILTLVDSVKNSDIKAIFKNYIVKTPEFEVKPGTYKKETDVTMSASSNSQIFYSLDGTKPTTESNLYSGKITLKEGTFTIRAIAVNDFDISSKEKEGKFEIILEAPEDPKASVESGTYSTLQSISITAPEGCSVYYTWDGTNPNANSYRYTGPFDMMPGNNILSIIAIDKNEKVSDVVRYNYIYNVPQN